MRDENQKVSRRFAIAALSAVSGALAIPGVEGVAEALPVTPGRLVSPLTPGSRFGRWQLENIGELDQGALEVTVSGQTGTFRLEILARDGSAWMAMSRAPGETEHFAVHVVNEGDGSSRTDEDHGLCAMTLATFIAKNESAAALQGFSTLAHRLDLERRGLLRRP